MKKRRQSRHKVAKTQRDTTGKVGCPQPTPTPAPTPTQANTKWERIALVGVILTAISPTITAIVKLIAGC